MQLKNYITFTHWSQNKNIHFNRCCVICCLVLPALCLGCAVVRREASDVKNKCPLILPLGICLLLYRQYKTCNMICYACSTRACAHLIQLNKCFSSIVYSTIRRSSTHVLRSDGKKEFIYIKLMHCTNHRRYTQ